MKNILVLTDFSENAKAAEEYALQLAMHVDGNFDTLHYLFPPA